MRELLLEKIDSIPTDSLLINRYLQVYYDHKPEDLDPDIPIGFLFEHDTIPDFTLQESKVFKLILDKVSTPVGGHADGFVSFGIDEKLGVIAISTSTPDPELSLIIIDFLLGKTIERIDRNTLFSPQVAYEEMAAETDSLADNYRRLYYDLNKSRDTYERYLKQPDSLISEPYRKSMHNKILKLEVEAEINKTGYLASLEQLKGAKIDMDNETVLMQLIDKTLPPIDYYKPSAKMAAVKGGIGGFALALFLIVSFKLFKDVLREVDEDGDQEEKESEKKEETPPVVWYRQIWLKLRGLVTRPISFVRAKLAEIKLPRLRKGKDSED
ncbi:MAG: hypothetical protein HRU41_10885 [Saprospiraceae bacterium]|nr:hypothetical protein [Saprospiraceae bacterium]